MEALRINDFVGDNGIKIDIDKLKQFKNKEVEIIILPVESKANHKSKNKFFNAIGKIDINEEDITSLREVSSL